MGWVQCWPVISFYNRRVDILILFSDHIGYQYQYEKNWLQGKL